MSRKRYDGVYTLRSRVLTLLAAIVMIGCVPFHYSGDQLGIVGMFAVAIISMISTVRDSATAKKRLSMLRAGAKAQPKK
jgi:hypothetical protein